MSAFVDFSELKKAVSIEAAVQQLGLTMKSSNNQMRGACPACKAGGDRTLVVTPSKNAWYCFSAKVGGDVIALASHILGLSPKDAAAHLAQRMTVPSTVPEADGGQQGDRTLQPLSYLEPAHDAVIAVGFCPDFAKKNGIGYAGKGIMRGTVAIPFRDENGTLLGYIGVEEAVKLPADFTPNVVSFKKTA